VGPLGESGDIWLGRSGSGMWHVGTSKVVAPTCVGYGPMGWPPRASIECTDCILVIWAHVTEPPWEGGSSPGST
jgi:hypothetical protein